MVTTSTPPLEREADVLRKVIEMVEERLPRDWLMEPNRGSARGAAALIKVVSPQGDDVILVVEVKRSVAPRDLQNVVPKIARIGRR